MSAKRYGPFLFLIIIIITGMGCTFFSFARYEMKKIRAVRAGMTREEVKKILGEPAEVNRRLVQPGDFREVWTFHAFGDPRNHLYPTTHFLVFRNEKVIGWDFPDPYRPDL